ERDLPAWNATTGRRAGAFRGPGGRVVSAAFNAGGTLVAAGTDDGRLSIWATASRRPLAVLRAFSRAGDSLPASAVALSPQANHLAPAACLSHLRPDGHPRSRAGPRGATVYRCAWLTGAPASVSSPSAAPAVPPSPAGRVVGAFPVASPVASGKNNTVCVPKS